MIYFAQPVRGGYIKIGTSKCVASRLQTVAYEVRASLRLLGTTQGGYAREQRLHRRFSHLRVVGEWFKPRPELMGFIADKARPAKQELRTPDFSEFLGPPRYGNWPVVPARGAKRERITIESLRLARRRSPTIWLGLTDDQREFGVYYDYHHLTLGLEEDIVHQGSLFMESFGSERGTRRLLAAQLKTALLGIRHTEFVISPSCLKVKPAPTWRDLRKHQEV